MVLVAHGSYPSHSAPTPVSDSDDVTEPEPDTGSGANNTQSCTSHDHSFRHITFIIQCGGKYLVNQIKT